MNWRTIAKRPVRSLSLLLLISVMLISALIVGLHIKTVAGAEAVDAEWEARTKSIVRNLGSTRRLEITPLLNWHGSTNLATEAGVSYLVRTDTQTILFDVGWNEHNETPSPLQRNMQSLGVNSDDIDAVFISHVHRDHVGGSDEADRQTFSLGSSAANLDGRTVWTPTVMRYPGARISIEAGPRRLASGIATTGPISRNLAIGRIDEQALVVNVEGRGLIILVGCGHQTLPRLLTRIAESFTEPVYGLVGDLHYPVPEGRLVGMGIDLQRRLASGTGPLDPITAQQARRELDMLNRRGILLLALGGHDTSDEMIGFASRLFGRRFQPVRVGEKISVVAP
jgi:7,8-dihydropterin-6-yl-methyl-4-(beta-D-ribofuranosyl)aminobenzene 5'-phosphate synthase